MAMTVRHGKRERFNFEGATYHIVTRCNNRQNFIKDKLHFSKYIAILKKCKQKYGFLLYNYVIMNNHVHLIISLRSTMNISQIMCSINKWYARWYNECYNKKGHFWESRFYGELIRDDLQLLAVIRYIDLNPVRAKLCQKPHDWIYSGAKLYLEGRKNYLIDIPDTYLDLGKNWQERQKAYAYIMPFNLSGIE